MVSLNMYGFYWATLYMSVSQQTSTIAFIPPVAA